MNKIIAILSISLLILGGCTTKQAAEAPINTVEKTTIKEITVKETTTEKATVETTKVEETTVLEETKNEKSDNLKALEEKYNGKSYDEIMAIEGWKKELNDLHKQGYYLLNYEGYRRIVDKDTAIKMIESVYEKDVTGSGVGCITSEGNKFVEEVASSVAKKKSEAKAEAFSSEASSHIKVGSGVATVINDLNPYGYTTNNLGYVVPHLQAYQHMQTLKGGDLNLYKQTEIEVFKKNNAGKATVRNNRKIEYNGSQGTFNGDGIPMWKCREPNFETTSALGGIMYAHCNYGYEEFREYCGGTTTAFMGWGEDKCDPYEQKNWCDAHNLLDKNLSQFVDFEYQWIGADGDRKYRKLY